jgi:hypothetical protein
MGLEKEPLQKKGGPVGFASFRFFCETIKISRGSSEGRKPPKEGVCFNVFDFLLFKT